MKTRNIFLYYLALVVILLLWQSEDSAPPIVLRLIYLLAVIAPSFTQYKWIVPAALSCIWMITMNGYAYSFMPTEHYLYVFVLLVCYFFTNKEVTSPAIDKRSFIALLLYVTMVNLVAGQNIGNMSYCLMVIILFMSFFDINSFEITKLFSLAFIVFSIVISCFVLENRNEILMLNMHKSVSFERLSWVDPNYMGMQIGLGSVIGISNLFFSRDVEIWEKILSIIVIMLSIPAILLTGSRGATLCVVLSFLVFVVLSNIQVYRKVFIVGLLVVLLYFLFSNNYFDLLINRINNDDGTGSNRTLIWTEKLQYFGEKSPLVWFFGLGQQRAYFLNAQNEVVGFHNDYLAALCSYGIIGFILLMYMLMKPLNNVKKHTPSRTIILGYTSYIFVSMLTLEPITIGVVSYYIFILYMYLISCNSWNE